MIDNGFHEKLTSLWYVWVLEYRVLELYDRRALEPQPLWQIHYKRLLGEARYGKRVQPIPLELINRGSWLTVGQFSAKLVKRIKPAQLFPDTLASPEE
jgi:hypothetical protein